MQKPIELIYSQQASDFVKGRAYSNPRFYSTPRSGISKVYIVGDWPKIVEDYTALGVPVERLDAVDAKAGGSIPAPKSLVSPEAGNLEARGAVVIPDAWAELAWSKPNENGLTLRGLATSLSDVIIINKADANAAIEAEIARRAALQPAPVISPPLVSPEAVISPPAQ